MNSSAASVNQHALPPRIVLRGSAIDRGRQYGEQCAERIARSIANYTAMFAAIDMGWAEAQDRAAKFEAGIEARFPSLLVELRGVSEGSGVSMASLMALNCRTELLPPDFIARLTPATDSPDAEQINECTSLAVARTGCPVLLAQNWDWLGNQRESLVMLESHPDDGVAHLNIAEAGMLAKIGLNKHGFGITLNILRSTADGSKLGMPVHFVLRALLDCENVEQAIALVSDLQFAGSSNILMADRSGAIASIEGSPFGVRVLSASDQQLCHTNHFLHPDLAPHDAAVSSNMSTGMRYERATAQLPQIEDIGTIRTLLSDTSDGLESVCRFPDPNAPDMARIETVIGVIMDMTQQVMHVSAAQPQAYPFVAHSMSPVA